MMLFRIICLIVLLYTGQAHAQAFNYKCDSDVQVCEEHCRESRDPMRCSIQCNNEYNRCREFENRYMQEQNRSSDIVPPNVWTPEGIKQKSF
jgi:hypothetical protein